MNKILLMAVAASSLISCMGDKGKRGSEISSAESGAVVPVGWDPGMKSPKGVGISLDLNLEKFSFCPGLPGGNCDSIPDGGGFYSISVGSDFVVNNVPTSKACRPVRLGAPDSERSIMNGVGRPDIFVHNNVKCPYYFDWVNDNGLVASMAIDSNDFKSDQTPNIYIGLQRNVNNPPRRGGMTLNDPEAAPPMNDVDEVSFKYRTSVCDKNTGSVFFGRGLYILEVYNPTLNRGMQLSINLFEYLRGVQRSDVPGILVNGVKSQDELASHNEHFKDTWHLNGPDFTQFVTLGNIYTVSADPSCSSVTNAQWQGVTIKLKQLLQHLAATVSRNADGSSRFHTDAAFWDGAKFSGGTIAGIEFLGRGQVNLQVRDFTMVKKVGSGPVIPGGAPQTVTASSIPPTSTVPVDLPALLEKLKIGQVCDFSASNYLQRNPDLRPAGITDEKALEHYRNFGIKEGRPGGCAPTLAQLPQFVNGSAPSSGMPPQPSNSSPSQPNPAVPSSWVGVKCNHNGGAAGKVSDIDNGVKIICLEAASGGFAWQIFNPSNINGAQCKTSGAQQQGLTCKPFTDSTTGFRWLP